MYIDINFVWIVYLIPFFLECMVSWFCGITQISEGGLSTASSDIIDGSNAREKMNDTIVMMKKMPIKIK